MLAAPRIDGHPFPYDQRLNLIAVGGRLPAEKQAMLRQNSIALMPRVVTRSRVSCTEAEG